MTAARMMKCDDHGETEWKLTLICGDCHSVYQAVAQGDDFLPICPTAVKAPVICECGANLPKRSARAICTSCFVELSNKAAAAARGPVQ